MTHARPAAPAFLSIALAALLAAAVPAATGPASAQDADEITLAMPQGWVPQALRGGPELKAHYVLMRGGRPFAEMYLSQTALAAGRTLDAVFQDGLNSIRPQLPYYQARGTRQTTVAGQPAIQHDFVYMPSGAGVMFAGRTYTLTSGSSAFTFFFQTAVVTAAAVESSVAQAMAGVKMAPRTEPGPPRTLPGAGLIADDMGVLYDLPAGWAASHDPQGAKYRLMTAQGLTHASLFIFKSEPSRSLTALMDPASGTAAMEALESRIAEIYKTYEGYAPGLLERRTIAGYPGAVHDFTFKFQTATVVYRAACFAEPGKSDDPNIRVAPTIHTFAFSSLEANRADELRAQWDAIMASMRPKTAVRPAPQIPADVPIQAPPEPPIKPAAKVEGDLPDLAPEAPEGAEIYAEPFGRYRVTLPEGAVQEKVEDNAAFYRMPSPKTAFIVHSFRQDDVGARLAARFAEGRKPNGLPTLMSAGGRNAKVTLYTARDESGETMAWVVALYPGSGLLTVISLPAKDYPAAKGWIQALLKGVLFEP
jgi:hypothetical protein